MQTRTPLLNTLRRAFQIALRSQQPNSPTADELTDQLTSGIIDRRHFIGNIFKTGVALGAAGVFNNPAQANWLAPTATTTTDNTNTSAFSSPLSHPGIVIIGAGMAGLNCAYELKKSGYSSTIYEAADRSGGRMFSKNNILAPGLYTELGGEFIDTEHQDIIRRCKEFGLTLLDTRTPAQSLYARDTFYIDGRFYSEAEVIRAFQPYASRIAADINSLPEIPTYDKHNKTALRYDAMSITDYFNAIGISGFIRKGIETAYVTEYGLEAGVQSSLSFLYLFSPDTSKGFKIFGTSDERYKIEGGNQTLTNILFEKVRDKVFLEHYLTKIKQTASGYTLWFKNGNTTRPVNANIIVSAIPFSILRNVELDVELPSWKRNAIQKLEYGTNSKLLLGFKSKVWRKYKYSGYVFTDKAIQTGWDNSWAQSGNNGGFTVYGGGKGGLELGTGTPESQSAKFISQLNEMWPGCKDAFNGTVKRMHWPDYAYTRGSYACYKMGHYTSIRGAEIKNIGNFYFAGEHCSGYYQGFMNGAAETGRIAAQHILKAVKAGKALAYR